MAMKLLQAINNYLFVRQAKQYISETERERRFVSYDKAKSVLILFESDFTEKNPAIRRMIAQLQQDGKKVSAWGFIDKKEIMTSILPDFRILHHKQTDFFQKPVISYINELEVLEFDLLLDLTIQPILPLQYFALYSKATFKVGAHKTDAAIYDFVLDIESLKKQPEEDEIQASEVNEVYMYDQIIFYLKSIQTND
jgi:hypothetical protein